MTPYAFPDLLRHLIAGHDLSVSETEQVFTALMDGVYDEMQMAALLVALAAKGETAAELAGGARVLRGRAAAVVLPAGTLDTCGTGGDGHGTLNISTATAIVAAACGVPVAKHGNRAVSSKAGSADVLERLGVNLLATEVQAEHCLRTAGLAFLFAPHYHAAMRHVAPVRKALGVRTLFNLLGPLSHPGGADFQLMGVYAPHLLIPMAEALRTLGSRRAWVVHGSDGLDELTTTGHTTVAELRDGQVQMLTVTPEQAGLPRAPLAALCGGDPAGNAAALSRLLDGETGAYRDIVLLNVAAALVIAGRVVHLPDGVALAAAALDSGAARRVLQTVIDMTQA
jgi:anthranilate phosphoribosyltransferase